MAKEREESAARNNYSSTTGGSAFLVDASREVAKKRAILGAGRGNISVESSGRVSAEETIKQSRVSVESRKKAVRRCPAALGNRARGFVPPRACEFFMEKEAKRQEGRASSMENE